ncbi:hypothetical protein [Streptomyces sp. KL116D]|uniref:hypothetical protein n=1 Tax=Streptomyces sp. KL116D TaxID=3045152 RepID=UPI00355933C6
MGSTRQDDGTYALIDPAHGQHRPRDSSDRIQRGSCSPTLTTWGDGTAANPETAAVDAAYGAQTTWDSLPRQLRPQRHS